MLLFRRKEAWFTGDCSGYVGCVQRIIHVSIRSYEYTRASYADRGLQYAKNR